MIARILRRFGYVHLTQVNREIKSTTASASLRIAILYGLGGARALDMAEGRRTCKGQVIGFADEELRAGDMVVINPTTGSTRKVPR